MTTAWHTAVGSVAIAAMQSLSSPVLHVAAGGEESLPRCAPALSFDGDAVAFTSAAALVALDRNERPDVYVLDQGRQQVELVSRTRTGGAGNKGSYCPTISRDGRFVAFLSDASDLTAGGEFDTPGIFLADRLAGSTIRLTARFDNGMWFGNPVLSGDGTHVLFTATRLSDPPDIRRHDVVLLTIADARAAVLGVGSDPSLSDDASVVAFEESGPPRRVWIHDGLTARAVTGRDGAGPDGDTFAPRLSGDGRWLAFVSRAGNMLSHPERGGRAQVYIQRVDGSDRALVSMTRTGAGGNGTSTAPSIDHSGERVTFHSRASNLACVDRRRCQEDVNLVNDVFVWDRRTRRVQQVSGLGPEPWMDPSETPGISGDGRVIAFLSRHPMHEGDGRRTYDLFLRQSPVVLLPERRGTR